MKLTKREKQLIDIAFDRFVKEYGDTLRMLGKESYQNDTNKEEHKWKINDLGMTICSKCRVIQTIPLHPPYCKEKKEEKCDCKKTIQELHAEGKSIKISLQESWEEKALLFLRERKDGIEFEIAIKTNGSVVDKDGFMSYRLMRESLVDTPIDISDLIQKYAVEHLKQFISQERSKLIEEIREWAQRYSYDILRTNPKIILDDLNTLLDSYR